MSGILESAISEFLDRLPTERHFDAPFMALLRLHGYYDIHFLHGPVEFGKDFIAKRVESGRTLQYTFQSKLGDIGRAEWAGKVQPQCEEMAIQTLAHPGFDVNLERISVLVLTGRLVAQAITLSQGYVNGLAVRRLPPLKIWDHERLVEMLSAPTCLGLSFDWREFGHLLWEATAGDNTPSAVEPYTRRWLRRLTEEDLWRSTLEYSVVRDEFDRLNLGFHAFRLLLGLCRSVCAGETSGQLSAQARNQLLYCLRREVETRTTTFLEWHEQASVQKDPFFLMNGLGAEIVEVSVRAFSVLEMVALYIASCVNLTSEQSNSCRTLVRRIMSVGALQRPISDDYASSVVSIAASAAAVGIDASPWLMGIVEWVCQSYSVGGLGLAPARSSASDELWRTLGRAVDNSRIKPRRESAIAAAVLDAASITGNRDLYNAAVIAFLGVPDLVPQRAIPLDANGQFELGSSAWARVLGGEYPRNWVGTNGWKNGQPHDVADIARILIIEAIHG